METFTMRILVPLSAGPAISFFVALLLVFSIVWVLRWIGSFPLTG